MPMIAMTTNISTSVKAWDEGLGFTRCTPEFQHGSCHARFQGKPPVQPAFARENFLVCVIFTHRRAAGLLRFGLKTRFACGTLGPMKRAFFLSALLAAGLLAGCNKSTVPAAPTEDTSLKPLTHAQPRLRTMKIYLGPETLDAELALSPQEELTGMMYRTNIQDTDAMLFVLPVPQQADFWMKNCPESISAAYITADGVIQEIHHLEKNDTNGVVAARDDIQFVLETSDGWFGRHNISTGTVIQSERGPLANVFLRR
jgi:hypothetical protein